MAASGSPAPREPVNTPLECHELQARRDAGKQPLVLDVRSRWEYRRGHIPGARHVPFWQPWKLRAACPADPGEVIVTCGHGPRAWLTAAILRRRGIPARLLRGHMTRWKARGLPLDR